MSAQERKIVLAIDDSPENLDLFHNALSDEHKVVAALCGEDTLEVLQEGIVPDLVLTDINLTGMSGFEICKYLRANTETENIPVVFISGLITDKERSAGLNAGGNEFISKPFSLRELIKTVNSLLDSKSL